MAPELPVIYENPRFDHATPTLQPVINRAVRFGAILLIEWGSLTLIEDSPRYLKYASIVVAVLVLAVYESWPWLRLRGRLWFPSLMGSLIAVYAAIFAYAEFTHLPSNKHEARPTTELSIKPSDAEGTPAMRTDSRAGAGDASTPRETGSRNLGLTDSRRWQILKSITDAPPTSSDGTYNCSVTNSLNDDGSFDFRKSRDTYFEVQEPLYYAGWRFFSGRKSFVPRGITIIADSKDSPSWVCANRLKDLLVSLNISPVSTRIDSNMVSADECARKNCLEVLIGKLDTP